MMLPQLQQIHLSTVASKTSDFLMILSLSSQLRLHAVKCFKIFTGFQNPKTYFLKS